MDFKNGAELLDLCSQYSCSISQIMRRRECELGETTQDVLQAKMERILSIMKESATSPIKSPRKSIGGLIGGEARLLNEHRTAGKAICGNVISRAITYACAVLEVNTSMGLIVAAPTAGSSGVVPGVLLAPGPWPAAAAPRRRGCGASPPAWRCPPPRPACRSASVPWRPPGACPQSGAR